MKCPDLPARWPPIFFLLVTSLLFPLHGNAQESSGEYEPQQQLNEISASLKELVELFRGINPSDTPSALTMQLEMMDRMVSTMDADLLSLYSERDKLAIERVKLEGRIQNLTKIARDGSSTAEHRESIMDSLPEHKASLERSAEHLSYVSRRIEEVILDLQIRKELRARLEAKLLGIGES